MNSPADASHVVISSDLLLSFLERTWVVIHRLISMVMEAFHKKIILLKKSAGLLYILITFQQGRQCIWEKQASDYTFFSFSTKLCCTLLIIHDTRICRLQGPIQNFLGNKSRCVYFLSFFYFTSPRQSGFEAFPPSASSSRRIVLGELMSSISQCLG